MAERTVLILNGPGLADAGAGGDRHGDISLEQIRDECSVLCAELGMRLEFRQTDDSDELSRWIVSDTGRFDALIINPASHAAAGSADFNMNRSARETIAHLGKPIVEVHLTNVLALEGAERITPLKGPDGKTGFVCGLGLQGYSLGIKAVAQRLPGNST